MTIAILPFILRVLLQLGYAVNSISSQVAIQSGMSPLILVAYRQIFATIFIFPFAYFLERNSLPRMTKHVMLLMLFGSLTGITGDQVLVYVGLKYSTATIQCALTNLLPAFTFVLALIFRQENLRIKKKAGLAKVLGTILCVSGALLLSFYHGKSIGSAVSGIHWRYVEKIEESSSAQKTNYIGPLAIISGILSWSVWFVIQTDLSKKFPAPYTSTTIMCFLASIQCVTIAFGFEHKISAWSLLHSATRPFATIYGGIVCTGLACYVMSWTIERKGPLYVSIFTPLQLIIAAILDWALLHDKIYIGTVAGSSMIVVGLYSVLWGKSKEANKRDGTKVTVEASNGE